MALHRLQHMSIGVPDTHALDGFYQEIGLTGGNGTWGSSDRPAQISLTEAPFRQLHALHMACEDEADLHAAESRLAELGVSGTRSNGRLTVIDPVNQWQYVLAAAPVADVAPHPQRLTNYPGARARANQRADVIVEARPRPPRRLGHLVVGSPEPRKTAALCQALGFRVSDSLGGGMATFMRCSPDHHNLLVTPGPVPYLNHYALEHDDFDAVMKAATEYLNSRGSDHQVAGPGRHQIGGNIFWYMLDPSGTFFEFFADMDQIPDDDAWQPKHDWNPASSWSVWGEQRQPEVLFAPADIQTVIAGWNAQYA